MLDDRGSGPEPGGSDFPSTDAELEIRIEADGSRVRVRLPEKYAADLLPIAAIAGCVAGLALLIWLGSLAHAPILVLLIGMALAVSASVFLGIRRGPNKR